MHPRSAAPSLELKIPPLGLVIIAALFMWLGASNVLAFDFHFPGRTIAAWAIALAGLFISALVVIEFKRAKTTVNPTKPQATSSLVTTGIYKRTRNPMYVGFFLILAGWAMALGNVIALAVLPGFVIYMNRFQIQPEERTLTLLFGGDFNAYCLETRRWI